MCKISFSWQGYLLAIELISVNIESCYLSTSHPNVFSYLPFKSLMDIIVVCQQHNKGSIEAWRHRLGKRYWQKKGHEKMTIMVQKKWQIREGVLKLIWLYVTLIISIWKNFNWSIVHVPFCKVFKQTTQALSMPKKNLMIVIPGFFYSTWHPNTCPLKV